MPNVDASFNSEVLRRDDPNIIAANRQQAVLLGVRLAYNASGYLAGTVLGQNSTNKMFYAYNDSGASGIDTAVCVLESIVKVTDFVDTTANSVNNSVLAPAIFGATVFYAKLTDLDANAITDLHGRKVTDVTGTDLLIFG